MTQFKWKQHTNIFGTVYYTNYKTTNWNVQIREYKISGTNQKNVSASRKVYEVYANDGYGNASKLGTVKGLQAARRRGETMLLSLVSQNKGAA